VVVDDRLGLLDRIVAFIKGQAHPVNYAGAGP